MNEESIVFMGVQDFHPWQELLPDAASQGRAATIVAAAYGVGIVGGLFWGGLRGIFAGWAAAAALKYGMGTVVYFQQEDPAYQNVAKFTGVLTLADLIVASWLARSVIDAREDEGRSAWGLAH
jgi:hypothetical protein